MNIDHLRRSLKAQWLNYYRENRVWLTRLGVWVNCEGNRRPSSSFILATLSVLEPQLTQMLPLVVDLSSNPDRIVMALGLNFNPDEELTTMGETSLEEVKLLSPFSVALPRLVQPMTAQTLSTQAVVTQAVATQAATQTRKERSPVGSLATEQVNRAASQSASQPASQSASQSASSLTRPPAGPELRKPEPHRPESDDLEVEKFHPAIADQPQPSPKPVAESAVSPLSQPALERPKAPLPSFSEPLVKQRPPMDTAELAQGQQPDRATPRKRKGDRSAPPART